MYETQVSSKDSSETSAATCTSVIYLNYAQRLSLLKFAKDSS